MRLFVALLPVLIALGAASSLLLHLFHWGAAMAGWPVALGVSGASLAVILWFAWYQMDALTKASAHRRAAEEALEQGDYARAERLLLETLADAHQVRAGADGSRIRTHWMLAELYQALERWDEAIPHVRGALNYAVGPNPYARQARNCGPGWLTELLRHTERWPELEEFARSQLVVAGADEYEWRQILAEALIHSGQPVESIQQLQLVVQQCDEAGGTPQATARALWHLGQTQLEAGDAGAIPTFERLRDLALGDPLAEKEALARAHLLFGNPALAASLLEDVVEESAHEEAYTCGKRLLLLAEALLAAQRADEAHARFEQGLSVWEYEGIEEPELTDPLAEKLAAA